MLEAWTGDRAFAAFVNARSAFAALCAQRPAASVWLPAFVCRDLAPTELGQRLRFYPVQRDFVADFSCVARDAALGDVVLAVAYFGAPLRNGWEALGKHRPDLLRVEDRAQALDAGAPAQGAWTLHSPRKLLGVADGGLVVAPGQDLQGLATPSTPADADALWRPALLRAGDPSGLDNATWHAANQAKEIAMTVSLQAMTTDSFAILRETPIAPLAESRRRNWRLLDRSLGRWSATRAPAAGAEPPLGYLLRLEPEARDALLRALHAQRIFAALHWPTLAAPVDAFPDAEALTRELITLPCDHRYGEAEMVRIAAAVIEVLA